MGYFLGFTKGRKNKAIVKTVDVDFSWLIHAPGAFGLSNATNSLYLKKSEIDLENRREANVVFCGTCHQLETRK